MVRTRIGVRGQRSWFRSLFMFLSDGLLCALVRLVSLVYGNLVCIPYHWKLLILCHCIFTS